MADIELTCGKCQKPTTVSEFADAEHLKCRHCGEKLSKPKLHLAEKTKPTIKVAKPDEVQQQAEPTEWRYNKNMEGKGQEKEPFRITKHGLSWIIFLFIGGAMWLLRYADIPSMPAILSFRDPLIEYGPYSLIILHIFVVLSAFKHSVYQGILCLLIPGWSFYYLFAVTDEFIFRSIFAGVLVGVAQDSVKFYTVWWNFVYDYVQNFILSGGGDIH
jgi:hypothetical protein